LSLHVHPHMLRHAVGTLWPIRATTIDCYGLLNKLERRAAEEELRHRVRWRRRWRRKRRPVRSDMRVGLT
jgi:hypothetical protein